MPNPYHVRLAISQYGDQFRAELFTEDLGDTEGDLLPVAWESLDEWMPFLSQGAASLPPDAARKLGKELFSALLGKAENSKKWSEILAQAERQGRPLRILIDAATDAVRDLPYGLLCEPHDDYYLLRPSRNRPTIQFVRILRRCTPQPLRLTANQAPIRVLLAAAEPRSADVPPFECSRWLCELARGIASHVSVFVCDQDGVKRLSDVLAGDARTWQPQQLEPFTKTTRAVLSEVLAKNEFEILHVMAHGIGYGLLLCDEAGGRAECTAAELGEWCGESKLQMAFLQVCKASQTDGRGGFGGIAQQLLNPKYGNLAAVVASPYPLDAERSTPAAIAFYRRIAEGASPDEAIEHTLPETNWTWAFLELWVRPGAIGQTGTRGAFQFASPYRGLARFEERDAEIFFGREAETAELCQILQTDPVVAVVGDSGSGKSSLLQAGLGHQARQHGLAGRTGWRIISLFPGPQPAKNLMARLLTDDEHTAAELPDPDDWLVALWTLLKNASAPERPLLVIFDQFEEIFTICHDEAQRRAVASALAEAAGQSGGHFRLVLGMRSEYLGAAAALPGLIALVKRPWVLRPPGAMDIREIVARPAEFHGYQFEGPLSDNVPGHGVKLMDRILSDPLLSHGGGESTKEPETPGQAVAPLPLLEFALERLWLRAVDRGSYTFTHADYDQLGGLAGAITGHADEVYQSLPASVGPAAQALSEHIITGVVSARGTRRPRPRGDLENESGNPAEARKVIDHLVGERLLTIRSDPNNLVVSQVDIAHEVLIDRWERLKKWLSEDPQGRAQREEFEKDSIRWDQGMPGTPARTRRSLPGPDAAADYLGWIEQKKPPLSPVQIAFADELRNMIRRHTRRRRVVIGTMVALFVAAVVLAVVARFSERQARSSAEIAQLREREAQESKTQAQAAEVHAKKEAHDAQMLAADWALGWGLALCERDEVSTGVLWMADALMLAPDDATELRRVIEMNLAAWSRRLIRLKSVRQFPGKVLAVSEGCQFVLISPETEADKLFEVDSGNLLCQLEGTESQLDSVGAISPDGRMVVVAKGRSARLWDAATGKRHGPAIEQGSQIHSATFSPDGKVVVTGGEGDDATVRIWDVATGSPIGSLTHRGMVLALAFSPDGHTLLTGSGDANGGDARFWDTTTWQPKGDPIDYQAWVQSVAFSLDGRSAAIGGYKVVLWDVAKGRPRGKPIPHNDGVWNLNFTPDGRTLVTGSLNGTVRFWDAETVESKDVVLPRHGRGVYTVIRPKDQAILTLTDEGTVRIWERTSDEHDSQVLEHSSWVVALSFSSDGRTALTGSNDGTAQLWDLTKGLVPSPLRSFNHGAPFDDVKFSPDASIVFTHCWHAGTVRLWDAATGTAIVPALPPQATPVIFSQDVRSVLVENHDSTFQVCDVRTGRARAPSFSIPRGLGLGTEGPPSERLSKEAAAFSPDGQTLVTVSGGNTAQLWDVSSGRFKGEPIVNPALISHIEFSRDNRYVVSVGPSSVIRLWDAATGKPHGEPIASSAIIQAIAYSPDGESILLGIENARALPFSMTTGRAIGSPFTHQGSVHTVAFSPDGKMVLTGSSDRTARLWDFATHKPISAPLQHNDEVEAVAFSPDGKSILTASRDKTARLWRLADTIELDPRRMTVWTQVLTGMYLSPAKMARMLDADTWNARRQELDKLGGPPLP